MRSRPVLVLAAGCAAGILAGCGSSSDSPESGSPGVQVDEVGSEAVANLTPEECAAQLQLLEVAVQASRAEWGIPPADEEQLVDQGYLLEVSAPYDLDATGQVLPTPGGGCEGAGGLDPGASQPVEVVAPTVLAADDSTCELERRTLFTASETYWLQKDRAAPNESELVMTGFLSEEFAGYDVGPEGSVVAVVGGPCEQYEANRSSMGVGAGPSVRECRESRVILEVALEAHVMQTGVPPVDEQTLVDIGYLRELMPFHDLGPDGTVVAVPGSGCA